MKRALLFAVVAAVAVFASVSLIRADGAQAHATRWYWDINRAENSLLNNGLQWRNRYDGVDFVECRGWDRYLVRGGVAFFKHMTCYIQPDDDDPYYIYYHVVSRNTYLFYWGGYA